MDPQAFIELVAGPARQSYAHTRLFPSIVVAQAILETGWGQSIPADASTGKNSYNLFGIKGSGPAGSVTIKSTEIENGKPVVRTSEFRAYFHYQQSIEDHAEFLRKPAYEKVRTAKSPEEAAQALEAAGYATDPEYAEKLTRLIQTYRLSQYDQLPPEEPVTFPPWKVELGNRAVREGLLTSTDWLSKLDEPMPVWAVLAVALRLLDRQKQKE